MENVINKHSESELAMDSIVSASSQVFHHSIVHHMESNTTEIANSPMKSIVFIPPDAGTPAAEALAANAALHVSKVSKGLQKLRGLKGRSKIKNLNLVKQLKKHTKGKRNKHFSRNFKGKVIDGLHEMYTLTAGMMLGIRNVVGRSMSRAQEKLTVLDFNFVEKLVFPPNGNTVPPYITPPHALAHTFKFKSYAPKVFRRLREYFGIDPGNYMLSVCGNYNFIEFISNSKSGQFFFYSHDGKYMIKTQTKEENRFLRHIMPHYFKYLTEHPYSMLVRILGMHRVKMYHLRRKVHFVIMSSVFDTPEEIHTIYDLKGSLVGREATMKERESGGVLKDLDLKNENRKLFFGEKKDRFMDQLTSDAMFLASLNIMDYSLLVGIHDRSREDLMINEDESITVNKHLEVSVIRDTLNNTCDDLSPCTPKVGMHSLTPFRKMVSIDFKNYLASSPRSFQRQELNAEDLGLGGHVDTVDLIYGTPTDHTNSRDHHLDVEESDDSDVNEDDNHANANDDEQDEAESSDCGDSEIDIEIEEQRIDFVSTKNTSNLTSRISSHEVGHSYSIFTGWFNGTKLSTRLSTATHDRDGKGAVGFEGAHIAKLFQSDDAFLKAMATRRGISDVNDGIPADGGRESNNISDSPSVDEPSTSDLSHGGKVESRNYSSLSIFRSYEDLTSPSVVYSGATFGPGKCQNRPWTSRTDSGINSREANSTRGNEIYYIGIIDILQEYNMIKRFENFVKGFSHDRSEISAVDSVSYAKRFVKFVDEAIQ